MTRLVYPAGPVGWRAGATSGWGIPVIPRTIGTPLEPHQLVRPPQPAATRRNPRQERAVYQADDRPRRDQREPGSEDADEGVPEGPTAAHVLSGQPVDAIGDGGGEGERKGPEARTELRSPVQRNQPQLDHQR